MMKCFSERNINSIIVPVFKSRNHDDIFPKKFIARNTFTSRGKELEIYNYWSVKNFMCIDFLSDLICRFYFGRFNDDFIPQKKSDTERFLCDEEQLRKLEYFINSNINNIPDEFSP